MYRLKAKNIVKYILDNNILKRNDIYDFAYRWRIWRSYSI